MGKRHFTLGWQKKRSTTSGVYLLMPIRWG
jgi:hypothetical protein